MTTPHLVWRQSRWHAWQGLPSASRCGWCSAASPVPMGHTGWWVAPRQVASMASPIPLRSSEQTMSTSATPRSLELGEIRQPLFGTLTAGADPQAAHVEFPVEVDPDHVVDRPVRHRPITDLDHDGFDKTTG